MKRLGLPVPDGFTITTEACIDYLKQGEHLSDEVKSQLHDHLTAFQIEQANLFISGSFITCISTKWCENIYARYDGYHIKFRIK